MSVTIVDLARTFRAAAARWWLDSRGTFTSSFAVMAIPASVIMAGAVDYNNVVRVRQDLQTAADAAVLAASKLNEDDMQRADIALRMFNGLVPDQMRSQIVSANFVVDAGANTITADITAEIKSFMPKAMMKEVFPIAVHSASAIAKPDVKQLDVVMCIDGTGSMSPTLTAVKNNALNFESNLNAELTRRGILPFDAMRVRVIFYRDFGGNYLDGSPFRYYVPGSYGYSYKTTADADYWTYVGDNPPLKESSFFPLPSQRTNFNDFVTPETANGGGDLPESGLECVNSAMSSQWARIGDTLSNGKALEAIYPLVVVWTDAAAHHPSYSVSLKNPAYPAATVMPRNYADLLAKWKNSSIIDQYRKMLVFFGNPDLSTNDRDGAADGWKVVKNWPGFYLGGSLSDGNNNMVAKIADAIASRIRQPTLTH